MKEKIYTIPVMDAFKTKCECPLCILEKKLEDDAVESILGPFFMENESRIETNKKGFCEKHFKLLYKSKNRLGLALITETHMIENFKNISNCYNSKTKYIKPSNDSKNIIAKLFSRPSNDEEIINTLVNYINKLQNSCVICEKIKDMMNIYVDVIFYLWNREDEFKNLINNSNGFCLKHFKMLLEGSKKYLSKKDLSIFLADLLPLQIKNLKRVQEDVTWFTKKFDYRYNNAPWKNSKDALPRSIQKIVGYMRIK